MILSSNTWLAFMRSHRSETWSQDQRDHIIAEYQALLDKAEIADTLLWTLSVSNECGILNPGSGVWEEVRQYLQEYWHETEAI